MGFGLASGWGRFVLFVRGLVGLGLEGCRLRGLGSFKGASSLWPYQLGRKSQTDLRGDLQGSPPYGVEESKGFRSLEVSKTGFRV